MTYFLQTDTHAGLPNTMSTSIPCDMNICMIHLSVYFFFIEKKEP